MSHGGYLPFTAKLQRLGAAAEWLGAYSKVVQPSDATQLIVLTMAYELCCSLACFWIIFSSYAPNT